MNNQMIGVAILGVGGLIVWQMFKKQGVKEEVSIITSPGEMLPEPEVPEHVAEEYQQAQFDWQKRLAGEELPNGDKIFQPLDIAGSNPLRLYYAIVKERDWPGGLMGQDIPRAIGEVWLYNTLTDREVRLDELAKQKTMTNDAKLAAEQTFANAFAESCRINPQYHPWSHQLSTKSVKTGETVTSKNREWHRNHCDLKYNLGM